MITIDLANTIFIVCVAVGGILLLITVLLDDIVGGVLDFLHIGFDLGGVTLMPLLRAPRWPSFPTTAPASPAIPLMRSI